MILTKRTHYDSEDFTRSGDFYRSIFRIGGEETDFGFCFFKCLQCDFTIERGDDDISITGSATTVEDHGISTPDPSSLHTVSAYPHEVGRGRVFDEVGGDVHRSTRGGLRRERETSWYGFVERKFHRV